MVELIWLLLQKLQVASIDLLQMYPLFEHASRQKLLDTNSAWLVASTFFWPPLNRGVFSSPFRSLLCTQSHGWDAHDLGFLLISFKCIPINFFYLSLSTHYSKKLPSKPQRNRVILSVFVRARVDERENSWFYWNLVNSSILLLGRMEFT